MKTKTWAENGDTWDRCDGSVVSWDKQQREEGTGIWRRCDWKRDRGLVGSRINAWIRSLRMGAWS